MRGLGWDRMLAEDQDLQAVEEFLPKAKSASLKRRLEEFRVEAMAKKSRAPGCAGDSLVTVVETVPCTATIYFMVLGPSARGE